MLLETMSVAVVPPIQPPRRGFTMDFPLVSSGRRGTVSVPGKSLCSAPLGIGSLFLPNAWVQSSTR